jgi:predicted translin family RNA/ssDNA-binding protein
MTKAESINEWASDCDMCAQDAKGSADYAAYAFKQRNFEEARKYTKHLADNVSRLQSNLRGLESAIAKPE